MTTDWQIEAACRGKPTALFYPNGRKGPGGHDPDYGPALAICGRCPVVAQCRAQAVHDGDIDERGRAVHGVIGGVAPDPRRPGKRRRAEPKHGTTAGYRQHRRLGEDACAACLDALSRYNAEWAAANRDRRRAS